MLDQKPHIFIAGTGRAGTSFLVRFLTEAGLESTLSRNGSDALWDERAKAGLEEPLGTIATGDLPYLVKSPALHVVADRIAASPATVRAVIIPVRDLASAAASRLIVQHQATQSEHPWLTGLSEPWEESHTAAPGGAIFSTHPLDQARILAVGFHRLVETLVRHDIPLVFLHFPRLASDPEYLFEKLAFILPADTTLERVRCAVARVSEAENIRVEQEIALSPSDPALLVVENIALKREVERLRLDAEPSGGSTSPPGTRTTVTARQSAVAKRAGNNKLRPKHRRRRQSKRMKTILGSRSATLRHLLDLLFRGKADWQ